VPLKRKRGPHRCLLLIFHKLRFCFAVQPKHALLPLFLSAVFILSQNHSRKSILTKYSENIYNLALRRRPFAASVSRQYVRKRHI